MPPIDFEERASELLDMLIVTGENSKERRKSVIAAFLKNFAREAMSSQKLVTAGYCVCGYAKHEMPDYIDSGTTLPCLGCGAEVVFDVWRPEDRTKFFAIYEKGLAQEGK